MFEVANWGEVANWKRKRVLAVASGGGHFIQLTRLLPAFAQHDVRFVTTSGSHRANVGNGRLHVIADGNRDKPLTVVRMAWQLFWILLRERPDVVITTGAACGYFALRLAKWQRRQTIWVDSIANADDLSMSGKKVRPYADLWMTQWPAVAERSGATYAGRVFPATPVSDQPVAAASSRGNAI